MFPACKADYPSADADVAVTVVAEQLIIQRLNDKGKPSVGRGGELEKMKRMGQSRRIVNGHLLCILWPSCCSPTQDAGGRYWCF
jgi:hypothetical protein